MWPPLQQQAGLWLAQVQVQVQVKVKVKQAVAVALRRPSAQAQLGAVPVEMVELAMAGQEVRAVEGQAAVVQLPQQAALQVRAKQAQ